MGQKVREWAKPAVFLICLLIIVFVTILSTGSPDAADQENCMLCHRYSGIAAFVPETGTKKIIDNFIFTVYFICNIFHKFPVKLVWNFLLRK